MGRLGVLWIGMVLIFLMVSSSQGALLSFNPSSQSIELGESVMVDLVISGLGERTSPSLGGFDLFIQYDPSILSLSNVIFGDPVLGDQLDVSGWGSMYNFSSYSQGVDELWGLSLNLPSELISLQASTFTLATLTFNTLGVGVSNLEIIDPNPLSTQSLLSDEWGCNLSFNRQSGTINVVASNPVPEPASFILLTFGFGMVILRKKIKRS